MHWELALDGPKDSPFDGGVFRVDVRFPAEYPFRFPDVKFVTPIYHPNVKEDGEICKEMIGEKDWLPNSRFSTVIHTLLSMIAHPNMDHPINLQAGADFKEGVFAAKAREHTAKHAKP